MADLSLVLLRRTCFEGVGPDGRSHTFGPGTALMSCGSTREKARVEKRGKLRRFGAMKMSPLWQGWGPNSSRGVA
eukprot:366115-Chlamydomonas_euryale.AAC.8